MEIVLLILTLVAVILASYALEYFKSRPNSQDPPTISSKIPFVGHILGLIRHGVPYYARVSAKHALPVFSLDMFSIKIYVINSASLVSAVQRNSKTISFDPFLTAAANRMSGIEGEGLKLLQETESGGGGLNNEVLHSMHPALLGEGLDVMNRAMIKNLQKSLDDLQNDQNVAFDLHKWCRRAMGVASTDAVYGPLNPYKSEEIQSALWDFEANLSILLLRILPRITARKAFKARERIVASFIKYFEADGQKTSSMMTYGRWKTQHDAGATTENIARLEAAAGIGILSNTVPSTFWTIFEIYSRPALLAQLRDEIKQHAMNIDVGTGNASPGKRVHTIDLAKIRDSCPLLVSTFQEVLRLRSNGAPTRVVYKDILLNNEFLLKKGHVVQMPSGSINREHLTWGEDAADFDARRFLATGETKRRQRPTGFMSFGASPNICPGRHFASGEILALTAMLLLRYNIDPVNGWIRPALNTRALAASVTPPVEAFNVTISAREEFRGTTWAFKVTDGKGKFGLITG
jgi:cytochrome P450